MGFPSSKAGGGSPRRAARPVGRQGAPPRSSPLQPHLGEEARLGDLRVSSRAEGVGRREGACLATASAMDPSRGHRRRASSLDRPALLVLRLLSPNSLVPRGKVLVAGRTKIGKLLTDKSRGCIQSKSAICFEMEPRNLLRRHDDRKNQLAHFDSILVTLCAHRCRLPIVLDFFCGKPYCFSRIVLLLSGRRWRYCVNSTVFL